MFAVNAREVNLCVCVFDRERERGREREGEREREREEKRREEKIRDSSLPQTLVTSLSLFKKRRTCDHVRWMTISYV